jgi:hypothetical protein
MLLAYSCIEISYLAEHRIYRRTIGAYIAVATVWRFHTTMMWLSIHRGSTGRGGNQSLTADYLASSIRIHESYALVC